MLLMIGVYQFWHNSKKGTENLPSDLKDKKEEWNCYERKKWFNYTNNILSYISKSKNLFLIHHESRTIIYLFIYLYFIIIFYLFYIQKSENSKICFTVQELDDNTASARVNFEFKSDSLFLTDVDSNSGW